jgi:serine/threonine protein kinase
MKHGDKFGAWSLIGDEPFGQGGNSVVWRAESADFADATIKFLTRFDRYARFRDEVRFQQSLSNNPGVLPLLDAYLPDLPSKTNRPWLVTPRAVPFREHVEQSPTKLLTAVKIVYEVALTLTEIHASNAAHRDIKPENLFIYSERAVIGDFGIVAYPGKEAITTSGERLGPIYYVAPELIGNNDTPVDCRPGDVYALAKTLWVLSSGQRYPIPGNLSAKEDASRLSAYVNYDRAVLLDRLLDLATALNPLQRPNCSDFATELHAWLNEKQDPSTASISAATSARLQQLSEIAALGKKERTVASMETSKILADLHTRLIAMGEQFASAAGVRAKHLPDGNTNHSLRYFPYQKSKNRIADGNRCFEVYFHTMHGKTIVVTGCAVLESIPPANGLLRGGLVISANHRTAEYLMQKELEFRFSSARQQTVVAQFMSEMQDNLPRLAERLSEILTEENAAEIRGTDSR